MTPMISISTTQPSLTCAKHAIEMPDGRKIWFFDRNCPYCALDDANYLIDKMVKVMSV